MFDFFIKRSLISYCVTGPTMIAEHFRLIPALLAVLILLARSRAANVHFMLVKDESQSKQAHTANAGQIFAFAKHFQNNMVLQRSPARANIYGFSSEIGQKVICELTTHSLQYFYYSTTVQPGPAPGIGVWSFTLDPMEANVTAVISVHSEIGSLTLNNLIFGDVWICSGQSNMEFTVIQMLRAEEEMNDAQNYPNIRIMTVAEVASDTPLYDVSVIQQDWTSPSKDSIGGAAWSYFSAVCWLYGKNIHKALGVPIGLVATDWGGTPVEAWSSPEALAKCGVTANSVKKQQSGSYSRYLDKLPPAVRTRLTGPQNNSVLWNAMVNPLLGMTIYGAIWYQGEADAIVTVMMNRYNCTFPAMITDWRKNFNKFSNGQTNASFPFGFVQLAPNTADPTISVGFPDIRFHQTADWGYTPNSDMPNVFMAVTMDLPDFSSIYDSIHPQDKTDVGIRLGLAGLAIAYGWQEMFQGPFPVNGQLAPAGFVLVYGDTWNLEIRDTEGFELLCVGDLSSRWLPTSIIASNQTSITLFSSICGPNQQVQGVRYAWKESPCQFKKCAVYETVNGLPAAPFVVVENNSSNKKPHFKFDGHKYY